MCVATTYGGTVDGGRGGPYWSSVLVCVATTYGGTLDGGSIPGGLGYGHAFARLR